MSIKFFEDEPESPPETEPEPGLGVAKLMVACFIAIVLGCLIAVGMAEWGPPW